MCLSFECVMLLNNLEAAKESESLPIAEYENVPQGGWSVFKPLTTYPSQTTELTSEPSHRFALELIFFFFFLPKLLVRYTDHQTTCHQSKSMPFFILVLYTVRIILFNAGKQSCNQPAIPIHHKFAVADTEHQNSVCQRLIKPLTVLQWLLSVSTADAHRFHFQPWLSLKQSSLGNSEPLPTVSLYPHPSWTTEPLLFMMLKDNLAHKRPTLHTVHGCIS